jgi:hypothetical protein
MVIIFILGALFLAGCYDFAYHPSYVISQTPPEEEPSAEQR